MWLVVVLVLVGRMTEWRRQFWRITSGYSPAGNLFTAVQIGFQAVPTARHGHPRRVLSRGPAHRDVRRFIMRWRIWLRHRYIGDWLSDFAYSRAQFTRRRHGAAQGAVVDRVAYVLVVTIVAFVIRRPLELVQRTAHVEQFHGRRLELMGEGDWRLDSLATET